MHVIDHGPQAWYLLQDGDALFLEARCSNSAADYSWLIELNSTERASFAARGHPSIDELANAIHMSSPDMHARYSPYTARNASEDREREVQAAIATWLT